MRRAGKGKAVRNPGQILRAARNRVVEEAEQVAGREHPDLGHLEAALHDLWMAKLGTVTAALPGMRRKEEASGVLQSDRYGRKRHGYDE